MNIGVKYFPIIFFELFLLSTVLLFAYGPWVWGVKSPEKLYSYLLGIQIILFFGYQLGLKVKLNRIKYNRTPPSGLIKCSIFLNLALAIPTIYIRSGGDFNNVLEGFVNPGQVYYSSREVNWSGNYTEYVNIVLSPLVWSLMPWLFFYWDKLCVSIKVLGILAIIFYDVLPCIASGTNKGLFDILFIFIWSRLPAYFVNTGKVFNTNSLKNLVIVGVFLFLAIAYFSINISQRLGNKDNLEFSMAHRAENTTIADYVLTSEISPNILKTYASISYYLTQGYYGCALAMEQEFVSTYGIGNSRFLSWLIGEKLFDVDVSKSTYPARVGEISTWDEKICWSSIYPWLASDFTFSGVYFIFFIIGMLLSMSWISVLTHFDRWGLIVFTLLCVLLFYTSANNQIFQSGNTTVTFLAAMLLWLNPYRITYKTHGVAK